MKITLNHVELKRAISVYLRANAAVNVSDITFCAKREGTIAEVETSIIESEYDSFPEMESSTISKYKYVPLNEYNEQETPQEFQVDLEDLIDEAQTKEDTKEVIEEEIEVVQDESDAEPEPEPIENPAFDLDAAIANVEASIEEQETAPPSNLNTLSIAELLGS